MRLLALLFTALGLVAAAPKAAPRPWTEVATPVATGSYLIGNPKARVRMVEIVSYTCPHCADFVAQSAATIDPLVAKGALALEIRNQVHDPIDVAAATIARCVGAARFPAFHRTLYARQRDWAVKGFDWLQANQARLQLYSDLAQTRAIADGSGLSDLARGAGMSDAALDQCFSGDPTRAVMQVSAATAGFAGTPAFILNGQKVERIGWAEMKPKLAALGLK